MSFNIFDELESNQQQQAVRPAKIAKQAPPEPAADLLDFVWDTSKPAQPIVPTFDTPEWDSNSTSFQPAPKSAQPKALKKRTTSGAKADGTSSIQAAGSPPAVLPSPKSSTKSRASRSSSQSAGNEEDLNSGSNSFFANPVGNVSSPSSNDSAGEPGTPKKKVMRKKLSHKDSADSAELQSSPALDENKKDVASSSPKKVLKKSNSTANIKTSSASSQAGKSQGVDAVLSPRAHVSAIREDQEEDLFPEQKQNRKESDESSFTKEKRMERSTSAAPVMNKSATKKLANKNSTSHDANIGVVPNKSAVEEEQEEKAEAGNEQESSKEHGVLDAWEKLIEGTVLMKFGKLGQPHFRFFAITEDKKALVYFSKGKPRKQTRIEIKDITQITEGVRGKGFERFLPSLVDYRDFAFSIWYENGKSSLDLIARHYNDFLIWTKGLRSLHEETKSPTGIISGCMLELRAVRGKTKIIVDPSANAKNRIKDRKALAQELESLSKQMQDLSASLEDKRTLHIYIRSETMGYVTLLQENLKKGNNLNIDRGNLADLDYEVWWMQMQHEALINVMAAADNK